MPWVRTDIIHLACKHADLAGTFEIQNVSQKILCYFVLNTSYISTCGQLLPPICAHAMKPSSLWHVQGILVIIYSVAFLYYVNQDSRDSVNCNARSLTLQCIKMAFAQMYTQISMTKELLMMLIFMFQNKWRLNEDCRTNSLFGHIWRCCILKQKGILHSYKITKHGRETYLICYIM